MSLTGQKNVQGQPASCLNIKSIYTFSEEAITVLYPIVSKIETSFTGYTFSPKIYYLLKFDEEYSTSSKIFAALKFVDLLTTKQKRKLYKKFLLATIWPKLNEGIPIKSYCKKDDCNSIISSYDFKNENDITKLKNDINFVLSREDTKSLLFEINLLSFSGSNVQFINF